MVSSPPAFTEGMTVGRSGIDTWHGGPAWKIVTYSPFLKFCASFKDTVGWPKIVVAVVLEEIANAPKFRTSRASCAFVTPAATNRRARLRMRFIVIEKPQKIVPNTVTKRVGFALPCPSLPVKYSTMAETNQAARGGSSRTATTTVIKFDADLRCDYGTYWYRGINWPLFCCKRATGLAFRCRVLR